MINKLQEYFDTNIPNKLKSHIVQKRLPVPTRYSDSGTLTDDTGWEWKNLGYMWLPYEEEVAGKGVLMVLLVMKNIPKHWNFVNHIKRK